jgi:transcriptional regulator with XRE-family HTH domain
MAQFGYVQLKRGLKASYLLVENIRTLLAARGVDDKALAMYCGHQPAWLSKILSGERGMSLPDMDKVADFFGLTVSQLLQQGISPLTERRRHTRRSGTDRRIADRRANPDGRLHGEMPPFIPKGIPEDTKDATEKTRLFHRAAAAIGTSKKLRSAVAAFRERRHESQSTDGDGDGA